MNGYKGKLAFRKYTGGAMDGYVSVCIVDKHMIKNDLYKEVYADSVFIGECEVDVKFEDTREAEIKTIEREIKREQAESQSRINKLIDKKQKLLAIESK